MWLVGNSIPVASRSLDFLGFCILNITVTLQDFPDTLLLCMQYFMVDFTYISLLYTVLQILSYYNISFSLLGFSFLGLHDIYFFEDSNLSAALLTIAPF